MRSKMYEAMFKRRSIRRYAGPIDADAMAEVEDFAHSLRPLDPGIRTEVRFLEDGGVRGPFKVAAPHFLAIYSEATGDHAANAGFMLQQMDLFLSSRGIGSCWQGGPKPPKEAREASGLKYVISLAFGRPGGEVHRRSVAEFKRKPLAEVTDIEGMDDVLEAARLAPSGMNRQGWYFTGGDGSVDVLSARTPLAGRMGRIDAGIALCHLWLSASHGGKVADVVIEPPSAGVRRGYDYVATVKMH